MTSENNLHTSELIRAHIAAQPKKEYKSWRASSIGLCPRAHSYRRAGIEPTSPKDDRTLAKFKAGDIFHDFVESITAVEVERLGGTVSSEAELYDKELDLGGRYDLLIELGDKRVLKDVKSQQSGFFHRLHREATVRLDKSLDDSTPEERQRATREALWEKHPHMVMQLGAYMVLLERAGTPVDEGVIVRISKDDLSVSETHFKLSDRLGEREPSLGELVLRELGVLNQHRAKGTLAPCTCKDDPWRVKYCDYAEGGSCCSDKLAPKLEKAVKT